MPERIALLIGVNRYPSAGAGGPADRVAPQNDVEAWLYHLDLLGFARRNVLALSTAPGQREPNTQHVAGACEWFVRQLAVLGEGAQGLVFFAGRGDVRKRGGLLLSDYDGVPKNVDELAFGGEFDVHELAHRVRSAAPHATLLAMVDAGLVSPDWRAESATLPLESIWSHDQHVLLSARGTTEQSYDRHFCGREHGQFTWALSTLITQWQASGQARARAYPKLQMAGLAARAAQLMAAISPPGQPQQPSVWCGAAGRQRSLQHFLGPDLTLEWHAESTWSEGLDVPASAD